MSHRQWLSRVAETGCTELEWLIEGDASSAWKIASPVSSLNPEGTQVEGDERFPHRWQAPLPLRSVAGAEARRGSHIWGLSAGMPAWRRLLEAARAHTTQSASAAAPNPACMRALAPIS